MVKRFLQPAKIVSSFVIVRSYFLRPMTILIVGGPGGRRSCIASHSLYPFTGLLTTGGAHLLSKCVCVGSKFKIPKISLDMILALNHGYSILKFKNFN